MRSTTEGQKRYSPAHVVGAQKGIINGTPDKEHISKKAENHCHAIALHFMHYNFFRIHKSLRVTPVMAVGVTDKLWPLEDVINMMDVYFDMEK